MDAKDWSLHGIAKKQHGLITDEQAESVGFNGCAVRWRLEQGEWLRVLTGVARLYWADDTFVSRCWAALLWARRLGDERGSDYALSHETAAQLLGLDVASDTIHLTSPRGRSRPRTWLEVHRSTVEFETAELEGLQVTTPARTLLDLSLTMKEHKFAQVMSAALQRRLVSRASLRAELSRHGACGFGGMLAKRIKPLVRV